MSLISRPAADGRAASFESSARPGLPDSRLAPVDVRVWSGDCAPAEQERALRALEDGGIVLLADLPFALSEAERRLLRPMSSDGRAKNISFEPRTGALGGTSLVGPDRDTLAALLARFGADSRGLLAGLLPRYAGRLEFGRASLRPVSIEGRPASPRKDDRRLHVDAFPSSPVAGRRILRVFANVDPQGAARVWHVGEPFADFAQRFLAKPPAFWPGKALLLKGLGITKGRRSAYDQAMLSLHDRAKADDDYQRQAPRDEIRFPAGSVWIVYTDIVPHAAIAGQNALEQTFYLPIEAMLDPDKAPLRILERLARRPLIG